MSDWHFLAQNIGKGDRESNSALHYLLHLDDHQLSRIPPLPSPLSFLMVNYANGKNERHKNEKGPSIHKVHNFFWIFDLPPWTERLYLNDHPQNLSIFCPLRRSVWTSCVSASENEPRRVLTSSRLDMPCDEETKYIALLYGPWGFQNVYGNPRLQRPNFTLKMSYFRVKFGLCNLGFSYTFSESSGSIEYRYSFGFLGIRGSLP